jgi:hypothetical protein
VLGERPKRRPEADEVAADAFRLRVGLPLASLDERAVLTLERLDLSREPGVRPALVTVTCQAEKRRSQAASGG